MIETCCHRTKVFLPGAKKKDISVELDAHYLTLGGKDYKGREFTRSYYIHERYLSRLVDVDAELKDGILKVTLEGLYRKLKKKGPEKRVIQVR